MPERRAFKSAPAPGSSSQKQRGPRPSPTSLAAAPFQQLVGLGNPHAIRQAAAANDPHVRHLPQLVSSPPGIERAARQRSRVARQLAGAPAWCSAVAPPCRGLHQYRPRRCMHVVIEKINPTPTPQSSLITPYGWRPFAIEPSV